MNARAPWPLVAPNDDGIRPAGGPDRCFYCDSPIGVPHGPECVIVVHRVAIRVDVHFLDGSTTSGTWELDEPAGWEPHSIEFHKNGSSWCVDNFLAAEGVGDVADLKGSPKPGEIPDGSGFTIEVNQCDWGHVALKRTWLYIVGVDENRLPPRPPPGKPTHAITTSLRSRGPLLKASSRLARLTPPAFAEWLLSIAASARR